jgi:hypothetical protein
MSRTYPWKCDKCPRRFTDFGRLEAHKKYRHATPAPKTSYVWKISTPCMTFFWTNVRIENIPDIIKKITEVIGNAEWETEIKIQRIRVVVNGLEP